MVNIAIVGSRNIDTEDAIEKIIQLYYLYQLEYGRFKVITGACIGIDALAAQIAIEMLFDVHVVVPSGKSRIEKDWHVWNTSYEMMPKLDTYKDRNARVVALADELIALPSIEETRNGELTRSGTWQTVRLARKKGIPVCIQRIKKPEH